MRTAAAKQNAPPRTIRAPRLKAVVPGCAITRIPMTPPAIAVHRGGERRSPRSRAARSAAQTGVVNSIAVTTASGVMAMPQTQAY